jgi:hypothetical protein
MGNPKTVDLFDFSKVASVRDFGYKFSQYSDRAVDIVAAAKKQMVGFPDAMSDETVAEFRAGAALRKYELIGNARYRKEGHDTYIPDAEGGFEMTPELAMAYTPNEVGKLKGETPNLYVMVKAIRDDVSKYTSNKLGKLKAMAKALETPAARGPAKNFQEFLSKLEEDSRARRNNAEKKGEPTMSEKELTARWVAFHNWKPKA